MTSAIPSPLTPILRFKGRSIQFQRVLLPFILIAASATSAFGSVILVTDPDSPGGLNNVARDEGTGLDWLVWTASTNISYATISTQFGPGQPYEGWTHATRSQIKTLFDNISGNPASTVNWVSPTLLSDGGTAASAILSIIGSTITTGSYASAEALTADQFAPNAIYRAEVINTFGVSTQTWANLVHGENYSSTYVGHALVRASPSAPAVPEPSSIMLMGLGSIGLCVGRLRRRRMLPLHQAARNWS